MQIQALKIFNSIKLILFLILVLGVITVLTACGDLVEETETGACNSAMDARDYETAISVCTEPEQRKDKASAYMGLAGFDIINFLKAMEPGNSPTTYTDPTGDDLGTYDVTGASILNILQLSINEYENDTIRATKIADSKNYLDRASDLLHPCLSDNCTPSISTDEILLDTFALAFAMQLNQLQIYDNKTTSTTIYPTGDNVSVLTCTEVSGAGNAAAVLRPMDGHLWEKERNGMQCNRILEAITEVSDNSTAVGNFNTWAGNGGTGALPEPLATTVCGPIGTLTTYMTSLAANIIELKKTISLDGDKTKPITDADNSTNELMKAVGCPTS